MNDIKPNFTRIMGSEWSANIVAIDPERARALLASNEGNRKLRPGMVDKYAQIMRTGNWLTTPEPIIIGKSGRLLNGQHRLTAAIKAQAVLKFLVISGVDEGVFSAIDRGGTRTTAEALNMDKRLIEAARILTTITADHKATDASIKGIADIIHPAHTRLLQDCPSVAKIFSSAPYRAAASMRILAGADAEYVASVYRGLVLGRIGELPPIAQGFAGAVLSGRVARVGGSNEQKEHFARGWDLFDPTKRENTRISVKDPQRAADEAGAILLAMR